jgi:DNA repair protein RadC
VPAPPTPASSVPAEPVPPSASPAAPALTASTISPAPNRLRSLAEGDRPQERALAHGVGALADAELLALLLRSGTRGHDVMSLAARLLFEAGSLHTLTRWRDTDFLRLKGIGRVKALQLCTVMEVARRVLSAERELPPELHGPEEIYDYLRPRALGLDVEKCWVISLNSRNRVLRCIELTSGTHRQTLVRPVEVLREAVREGASALVLAHNHPSGDPQPSAADAVITRQLRAAAEPCEIRLHDHVILGDPALDPLGLGYYSFRRGGFL